MWYTTGDWLTMCCCGTVPFTTATVHWRQDIAKHRESDETVACEVGTKQIIQRWWQHWSALSLPQVFGFSQVFLWTAFSCMLATSMWVSVLVPSGCYSLHPCSDLYWGIKRTALSGIFMSVCVQEDQLRLDIMVYSKQLGLIMGCCCHNMAIK